MQWIEGKDGYYPEPTYRLELGSGTCLVYVSRDHNGWDTRDQWRFNIGTIEVKGFPSAESAKSGALGMARGLLLQAFKDVDLLERMANGGIWWDGLEK